LQCVFGFPKNKNNTKDVVIFGKKNENAYLPFGDENKVQ